MVVKKYKDVLDDHCNIGISFFGHTKIHVSDSAFNLLILKF